MKIILRAYSYDSFSTQWKRYHTVITENWPQAKALLKEAKLLGLKCKIIVQK